MVTATDAIEKITDAAANRSSDEGLRRAPGDGGDRSSRRSKLALSRDGIRAVDPGDRASLTKLIAADTGSALPDPERRVTRFSVRSRLGLK